jgi:outer membrane receptor protein involved in Fe transport
MPPSFLGTLSAPYQNAGKVENKGWELSATIMTKKGF